MARSPETNNVARMLDPRSVAVIGASADPVKMGARVLRYLGQHHFTGEIYPVSPRGGTIGDRQVVEKVSDLPDGVDCAILAIPDSQVQPVLQQCALANIGGAVVYAAGFAEAGADGRAAQDRIRDLARDTGMRVCGPNSNGLIGVHAGFAASSNPALEGILTPGGIGLVTQSGGIGLGSIPYLAEQRKIGFSYLISTGNEADLDLCDCMDFLIHDPKTESIALIAEGFRDPERFLALAAAARSVGKPVVILKNGRTSAGEHMVSSHTALIAGSSRVQKAVFDDLGIVMVEDVEPLYQLPDMLGRVKAPRGRKIGVVSPSGGAAILSADICEDLGIDLATLNEATVGALGEILPPYANLANPLDLTAVGTSSPAVFTRCVKTVLDDPEVDLLVVILTVSINYDPALEEIIKLNADTGKPILCIGLGNGLTGRGFELLDEAKVPLFTSFKGGFEAARIILRRAGRQQASEAVPAGSGLGAALTGPQGEHATKRMLADAGFSVPGEVLTQTLSQALSAAAELGYPVVLKGISRDALHKTDAGLVALDLRSEHDLRSAHESIARKLEALPAEGREGVLVQPFVAAGLETMIGLSTDPQFGPVVAFGLGGIWVEALGDVQLRRAPLADVTAACELIDSTAAGRIMASPRGDVSYDRGDLAELLLRVSRLPAATSGRLTELDLNPVKVLPNGKGLVIVDARSVFGA